MQTRRPFGIIGIVILIVLSALSSCKFFPLSIENFNALTEQATPLELGSFHEAEFIDYTTHTYRCKLEAGETYEINWKDYNSGIDNDAADIRVSTQFEGETVFTSQDGGYYSTRTYSSQSTGTLLVSIMPASDDSYDFGTYAIRVKKVVRTILADGEWYNGEFTDYFPQHFSFPVEAGKTYELRTNYDSSGDGSKTGEIKIFGKLNTENNFNEYETNYHTPKYVTASSNGFIYIKVKPEQNYSSYLGTWAVRIKEVVPTILQDNEWTEGVSTYFSTHLFQITLEEGETYEINWNHINFGDSTKTGRILVSAQYGDTELFSEQTDGYITTRTITPESHGLLSIQVKTANSSSSNLGTWAIRVKKAVPITLTDNVWTEGESVDYSLHHFTIPVVAGEIYEINWDDAYYTDGDKTGTISVTATCNSESVFTGQTSGYTTTLTCFPDADGYLNLVAKVYNNSSSYFGTWAVRVRKVTPVTLTDNVWADGESDDYSLHHFTIPVVTGEIYEINWDDKYNSTGSKTGRTAVTATCNGKSVFTNQTYGYITARSCIPDVDGYLNLVVKVYNNSISNFGTWAVRVRKVTPVTLTDNVWTVGESVDYSLHHFSIPVAAGEVYEINWQDSSSGAVTRTGKVKVSASCNGTSSFTDQTVGNITSRSIAPTGDGFIVITIKPYSTISNYLGTWAVRIKKVTPVTLTDNVWTDRESVDYSLQHFTIPVVAGEKYAINWQDSYSGDGTRTGWVKVSASCNETRLFTNQIDGYTVNRTTTPTEDGFIFITIIPYYHDSIYWGTWAVRVKKINSITLTDNVWAIGESVDYSIHHFTIPVVAGEMYAINWQDFYSGDGTLTGWVKVSASCNGTSLFTDQIGGYTANRTTTPTEDGFIVIAIKPYHTGSSYLGTWAIRVKKIDSSLFHVGK